MVEAFTFLRPLPRPTHSPSPLNTEAFGDAMGLAY